MTNKRGPYKIISSKEVYKNPWINVREDKVIRPDGKERLFGVVEMKSGVTIAAIDDENNIFLVKEYKYGLGADSLELISGGIDGEESALQAARRELKEESGLEADEWIELGLFNSFTTVIHSPAYLFLARNLKKGESVPGEEEFLELIKVPFNKAVEMVMQSEITHGGSCTCILKAYKHLQK